MVLLTAFLAVIMMRILKKDFSRYVEVDEEDLREDEPGWKLIHGDVFRSPKVGIYYIYKCIYLCMFVSMYVCNLYIYKYMYVCILYTFSLP